MVSQRLIEKIKGKSCSAGSVNKSTKSNVGKGKGFFTDLNEIEEKVVNK